MGRRGYQIAEFGIASVVAAWFRMLFPSVRRRFDELEERAKLTGIARATTNRKFSWVFGDIEVEITDEVVCDQRGEKL